MAGVTATAEHLPRTAHENDAANDDTGQSSGPIIEEQSWGPSIVAAYSVEDYPADSCFFSDDPDGALRRAPRPRSGLPPKAVGDTDDQDMAWHHTKAKLHAPLKLFRDAQEIQIELNRRREASATKCIQGTRLQAARKKAAEKKAAKEAAAESILLVRPPEEVAASPSPFFPASSSSPSPFFPASDPPPLRLSASSLQKAAREELAREASEKMAAEVKATIKSAAATPEPSESALGPSASALASEPQAAALVEITPAAEQGATQRRVEELERQLEQERTHRRVAELERQLAQERTHRQEIEAETSSGYLCCRKRQRNPPSSQV